MRILDQYGRPFDENALRTPQTGLMASVPSTWGNTPVDGLTPAKLLRILKASRNGDIALQSSLFSEMEERDPSILGDMTKRKNAVISRELQIELPQGATRQETSCAAFFEEYIEYLDLADHLLHALEGIGHGFSAFEFEAWGVINGVRAPLGLRPCPNQWFRLKVQTGLMADAWHMDRTDLRLLDGSAYGAELQPFGWWVHVHRALAGGLHRAGLFRVIAWLFLYKHFSLRDFAEFLEIYGIPPRLGKFDPNNITTRDKAVLYQALQSLGHDAAGIVPNTMQIELLEAAAGQTDGHERMFNLCNAEFAKAILGKDPQNKGGMGGGNAAQEMVNNEVREDINIGDCKQIANSFTNDVLWPIASLNFGITELRRCPRLKFNTTRSADREALGRSFESMLKVGIGIGRDWAYQQAQIPIPKEGEPLLALASAPTTNTQSQEPGNSGEPGTPGGTLGNEGAQPKTGNKAASTLSALLVASLAATSGADRDHIDDLADDMLDGWQPKMEDLLAPIRKAVADAAANGESLDSLQARLPDLLEQMDTTAITEQIARGQFVARLAGNAALVQPDEG